MGSCCSCCCCCGGDSPSGVERVDASHPQQHEVSTSHGKRNKQKRNYEPPITGVVYYSEKKNKIRSMSTGSSGRELQDVATYDTFLPLEDSHSMESSGALSDGQNSISTSYHSSSIVNHPPNSILSANTPAVRKSPTKVSVNVDPFAPEISIPLDDEATSFPQARNVAEIHEASKRHSLGAIHDLPWVKLHDEHADDQNLISAIDITAELSSLTAPNDINMAPSMKISPSGDRQLTRRSNEAENFPVTYSKVAKEAQDVQEILNELETMSTTSTDSATSLPVSRDLTSSDGFRRRASSQDGISWEKRLQLENEIAQHVRIAEMQEEVELQRRKAAYSEKEITTMKSQLDQALFKKAAAEAELREFDKRIRARDAQLRTQVEQLERRVAQGEAAQQSLERVQKQFSDLEVRLKNEMNFKIQTEAKLREKERQLQEMQAQMQYLAQEKARYEAMATTPTRAQPPRQSLVRTPSSAKKPATPTANPKTPVGRNRSSSARASIETQSDTPLYSPGASARTPVSRTTSKRAGTSTSVASPKTPVAPIIDKVDITAKDRSLFATRYINKTGSPTSDSKSEAPPASRDDSLLTQSLTDESFVIIPGPEETDLSASAD